MVWHRQQNINYIHIYTYTYTCLMCEKRKKKEASSSKKDACVTCACKDEKFEKRRKSKVERKWTSKEVEVL